MTTETDKSITGHTGGLFQDGGTKKLSDWFASRIDARHVLRQVAAEITKRRLENKPFTS